MTCQKRLYFKPKRNCKIQDKIGRNGLGNRCSVRLECIAVMKTNHDQSHATLLGNLLGHDVASRKI